MKIPFTKYHIVITRPSPKTCLHPDFNTLTEEAFVIEGEQYYGFKNHLDMPAKRHTKMNEFIREADMRVNRKDLTEYLQKIEDLILTGKPEKAIELLVTLKYRLDLFIESDTYYRLYSCAYFTEGEDLTDYDFDYNTAKIEKFKKKPPDSFFFMKPLRQYLPATNISMKLIRSSLKQEKVAKKMIEDALTGAGTIENTPSI